MFFPISGIFKKGYFVSELYKLIYAFNLSEMVLLQFSFTTWLGIFNVMESDNIIWGCVFAVHFKVLNLKEKS
jgi:hypothetical protein